MMSGISIIWAPADHEADGVPLLDDLARLRRLPDDAALLHRVAVFQRDVEEILVDIAAVVAHLGVIVAAHEIRQSG